MYLHLSLRLGILTTENTLRIWILNTCYLPVGTTASVQSLTDLKNTMDQSAVSTSISPSPSLFLVEMITKSKFGITNCGHWCYYCFTSPCRTASTNRWNWFFPTILVIQSTQPNWRKRSRVFGAVSIWPTNNQLPDESIAALYPLTDNYIIDDHRWANM